VKSVALENIPSMKGREEYIRVLVTDRGVTPLFGKSGLLNTLVRSNGLVRVPAGSEGVEKGDPVEVIQW
jgi:molybdopterin molybdotransferase